MHLKDEIQLSTLSDLLPHKYLGTIIMLTHFTFEDSLHLTLTRYLLIHSYDYLSV